MTRLEAIDRYREMIVHAERDGVMRELFRELARRDLFFLLVYVLGIQVANNDWVYARCREFESDPDGHLDLWAREHFKSTIVTLAAVIQAILVDPEVTVGIFSFNRPSAKALLRAIKWQFESNEKLKELFPEILYADPSKEAMKWNEDEGIVVRRKGLPKEMTVEASGLVDGMPTGKHYSLLVYDDVVTKDSVGTPEMIAKVTEAFSISLNLGKEGGRRWMVGTRYHFADTYSELIRRGAARPRIYAATVDGKFDGEPWLWSAETLRAKIRDMGTYVASCQLFNNPVMEGEETFSAEWLQYWVPRGWERMNRYILVDPANEKKDSSDYTVMAVVGLGADHNYYLIDLVRDRLSLQERARRLFRLHATYKPISVGYEKYGMQSDLAYLGELMDREQYRFNVVPLGGSMRKNDRIRRLQPAFENRRFYLPDTMVRVDYQGRSRDLTRAFIDEEYLQFPYMTHDDMLDCVSRIMDPDMAAFFPRGVPGEEGGSWDDADSDTSYDYRTFDYLRA